MKKGQTIGQVFVFIIAGLVFVLILGYGYRAITSFIERGQDVQLLDFRNELESSINIIKRDYGSVQKVELRLPANTEEACFVVSHGAVSEVQGGWEESFRAEYPLLYGAWETQTENVFLIPRQPTPLLVEDLLVDSGYICIPASAGVVSLRVEGTGNRARVGVWK